MIFFLRVDYTCISILIGSAYYPPIYYIFKCKEFLVYFYLTTLTVLAISCMILTTFAICQNEKWRIIRTVVFVLLAIFAIAPTIHVFILIKEIDWSLFGAMMLMYSVFGIGLLFYVTRFPERFYPGRFDTWFGSHFFWHVFVALGAYAHFEFILKLWNKTNQTGCLV